MRTRVLPLLLVSLLALSACSDLDAAAEAPGSRPKPDAPATETLSADSAAATTADAVTATSVPTFAKRKAMVHVRKFASDIGIRTKGSPAEKKAAQYFKRKLASFGYEVEVQSFTVDGATSRNVVARWPGARTYPLVIGGHIDSVPGSPGANDNASGVAAILELARIFAATPQAEFMTFVAFGSEEFDSSRTSHHDGSTHFVKKLGRKGRRRLAGMISVDMISNGRPLLVGNSNISGRHEVADTLARKIRKRNIDVDRITLCDCSDHGPFEHAGLDAAFAYSGDEPNNHNPSDTSENLVSNDLLRTGRALRFFLIDLDKELLDRFRAS